MLRHRTPGQFTTIRARRKSFFPQAHQLEDRVLLANVFVTNTNDSGTGSLRQAINDALSADHIVFQIPIAGNNYNPATQSWTIAVASPLPPIIASNIVIDGLSQQSQPGASTAHPVIEITPTVSFTGDGLSLLSSGNTVSGLVVNGFQGAGIAINGSDNLISGDYLGTDVTGMLPVPNQGSGIRVVFSDSNTIGGTSAAARNVISGNVGSGIALELDPFYFVTSDDNVIVGNYIGVGSDGQTALANNGNGIIINSGDFNQIGGTNAGEANIIANNGQYGVQVDVGVGDSILSNSIYGNVLGGIILTNGGNFDQVSPVLTQALVFADRTEITGTLAVRSDTSYLVQFFANNPASGQGRTLIGSQAIPAPATDQTVILSLTAGVLPAGSTVTAIASVTGTQVEPQGEAVGDTSAFSTAVVVVNPFIVTNTNDFGLGSLRFAIDTANTDVNNDDTITFRIPTGDPGYNPATQSWTILVDSNLTIDKLPAGPVQHTVVIDGLSQQSQPGATTAHPVIALAPGPPFAGNGLRLATGGNTVRGLVIGSFQMNGIWIEPGSNGNLITQNYLGTDVLGAADNGNEDAGVRVDGSSNTISGNVISGNTGEGAFVPGPGNLLLNNLVGTNAAGTAPLGNGLSGITLQQSSGNTIIGNVISGNGINPIGGSGILVTTGSDANLIQSNRVGTNAAGTQAIPNLSDGIDINGSNNTIGGTAAGAGNLISGNQFQGLVIKGPSAGGNQVLNNRIGTNAAGTSGLGNGFNGLVIQDSSGNAVVGNLLSGNGTAPTGGGRGILVSGSSQGNIIQGNRVGTDLTGTSAVPNAHDGVVILSFDNTVGGTTPGAGNVISGNGGHGLTLSGGAGNAILNNLIGVAAGGGALGNVLGGVFIQNASGNILTGNVISGNGVGQNAAGINVTGSDSTGNIITANRIGTNANGTARLGNSLDGVVIGGGAGNNTVGGTAPGSGNVISGNGGHGLTLSGTSGNSILNNFIGVAQGGGSALGNVLDGVFIQNASGNVLSGNVISGNGVGQDAAGVNMTGSDSAGNVIAANFIGTNTGGTSAVGNSLLGVFIGGGASGNRVAGNIISGNGVPGSQSVGVYLFGTTTTGNLITGNRIGTDQSGAFRLGDSAIGLLISESPGNTVQGNQISGNRFIGVEIAAATAFNNVVQGNLIGTDATGFAAIPNGFDGVFLNNTVNNTVGGPAAGAGNLISGNNSVGIQLFGPLTQGNVIQGNLIGLDAAGRPTLPNRLGGSSSTPARRPTPSAARRPASRIWARGCRSSASPAPTRPGAPS